eukprot:TRINITY_DN19002_c0_g1_i1.p1 TRINITY_DN19002_c0_g1~~TRINITY_DN19002_c0_g1_i1.p1  ORF type:complete len:591 (+),score=173.25 TRINITY_DN19002_c0_g1_i1:252-2024(+)
MLNGSQIIKGRWKIVKKIGQGAFGEIYQSKNILTNEMVAMKVERVDSKKQVLKLEVTVLKKLQDCPYVCRFITCGRFNDYNYMVMELLGDNLSELRRRMPDGKFSLATTLKLGQHMLLAIEAVHELGYLHRDVKPSNFAIGLAPGKRRTTFIIDFGLSRRFLLGTGEVRPARESSGFRGTARYASINSHLCKDLSRRDDLWSLLYLLIEFARGSLPWRKLKDKDKIGETKIQFNNADLVADLPSEFLLFMQHLQSLQYADRPDYSYMKGLLVAAHKKVSPVEDPPLDWEVSPPPSPGRASVPVTPKSLASAGSSKPASPASRSRPMPNHSLDQADESVQGSALNTTAKGLNISMLRLSNSNIVSQPTDFSVGTPTAFMAQSTPPPKHARPTRPLPALPQLYISSLVDDSSPKGPQHRRAMSLPSNLPVNPDGGEAQSPPDSTPGKDGVGERPVNGQLPFRHNTLPAKVQRDQLMARSKSEVQQQQNAFQSAFMSSMFQSTSSRQQSMILEELKPLGPDAKLRHSLPEAEILAMTEVKIRLPDGPVSSSEPDYKMVPTTHSDNTASSHKSSHKLSKDAKKEAKCSRCCVIS